MRIGNGIVTLLFFLFCFSVSLTAQQRNTYTPYIDSVLADPNALKVNCSVDIMLNQLRKDPAFVAREKKMNEAILNRSFQTSGFTAPNGADTVILPVVVHIIHTNPSAVTDQQVINAIKDLNDAFSKRGNYTASLGADTKIRFALAQRDPDDGNTNGITRTTSYYFDNMNMDMEDTRLKKLLLWDPLKYINIWVVNNIIGEISANFFCGVWTRSGPGGYATLPPGGSSTDGIVVSSFGVVLAHEMGHYLGLYHTFEGGCTNNNCLTDGDRVCDTPPDGTTSPSINCNTTTNSCNTDTLSNYSNGFFPRDTTDLIRNFMDYGNTACSNMFTQGQAERMQNAILTQRLALLGNQLVKPCSENILASFTRDNADPKAGDLVTFTNTSTGTSNYQWLVDGVLVSSSQNFSYTFPAAQQYKVTLKAFNVAGCYASYIDYLLVNCGVTARFFENKKLIGSKTGVYSDTILFANISQGATTYQWIMNNDQGMSRQTVTSNATGGGLNDLNFVFATPANYNLKLIASNGSCVDSTSSLFFSVLDPTPDAFVSIFGVTCYQQTKVRLNFYLCNSSWGAIIPPGTPVSFYDADPRKAGANLIDQTIIVADTIKGNCCGKIYTQILDVKYAGLNQIFAVVNDNGSAVPINLPNTSLIEKDYKNNVASVTNFKFKVTPSPAVSTMEPGDTLQLIGQTSPDPTASSKFVWSGPLNLNCTACSSPLYIADTISLTTKQVIATSQYQCLDTSTVIIKVPPYNDYTVTISKIICAGKDSLSVDFTLTNNFKRGTIPKDLLISFYKGDPNIAGAIVLAPVFITPAAVNAKQQNYTCKIQKTGAGTIYASVNDNGTQVPIVISNAPLAEKLYTNNTSGFSYSPLSKTIDTSVCNGIAVFGYTVSGTYLDTIANANGCDTLRILNLTVKAIAVQKSTITVSICQGASYAGYTTGGTYIDVFKAVNTCDSIRTLILTVNPVVRQTKNIQICKGDTYFAAGKLQTTSGTYVDSAKTYLGCDSIVTTVLTVYPLPVNFLPADTTMCIGKTLTITLSGYNTVTWSSGLPGTSIDITQAGAYSAQVIDRFGCKGSDVINVLYDKCIPIQIPTAFTPNHDGKNDVFKPIIGAALANYRMQIWNRWGQLIFETRSYNQGWNGTYQGQIQPNGAYIYVFTFTDPDGVETIKKGTLVLIR